MVGVLQNSVDDLDLPSCVGNGSAWVAAHEGRAKDDGEIVRVHACNVGVIHDAIEVKSNGAQGGVVGVREAVDDGVEGVSADSIVFLH